MRRKIGSGSLMLLRSYKTDVLPCGRREIMSVLKSHDDLPQVQQCSAARPSGFHVPTGLIPCVGKDCR